MDKQNGIPTPVVRRLTRYLSYLQRIRENDKEWVSSQELAQALSLTDGTVRQDLSHLDFSGKAKRGYQVEGLESTLTKVLGLDSCTKAVIVGAGNLGRALALHEDFPRRGYEICGIFDADPKLLGKRIGPLVVQGMDSLRDVVRNKGVRIGIVAVPAPAAQAVAEELASAGVRGLLNLSCAHVAGPPTVPIVEARIVESLHELSCVINMLADAK